MTWDDLLCEACGSIHDGPCYESGIEDQAEEVAWNEAFDGWNHETQERHDT